MNRAISGICLALVLVSFINVSRASGPFDGDWQNKKSTSGKAPCRLGKISFHVSDNRVTGEAETILIAVRNSAEMNKARKALMDAAIQWVTEQTLNISKGNGTVEGRGEIAVQGSIDERNGVFSGTLAGFSFAGRFDQDRFAGSVSFGICSVNVSAKRKEMFTLPASARKLTAGEIRTLYDHTQFNFNNHDGTTGTFLVDFAGKTAFGTFARGGNRGSWTGRVRIRGSQFCRKIENNREGCVFLYVDGADVYEVNSKGIVESLNRKR